MTIAALPPRPSDSHVQSFARGLAVIRSFNAERPAQTLSDVAQHTGLTRAGARRILLTLQGLGYVQAQGRLFSLTPKILDLGYAYLSSQPLWHLAEPAMQRLAGEVQESCSLAVLEGHDIVYMLRVPARRIMSLSLGVGSRLPAWCTSMGRMLLADLPEAPLQALLETEALKARTPHTLTAPSDVAQQVALARRQGWCLVSEELEPGLSSLAAPVVDRSGRTVAALNIGAARTRAQAQAFVADCLPPLRAAADDISALLRGAGGTAAAA